MTLASLISQAQDAVSILSNPAQSSVLAGGTIGAFSAEVNNLRQAAQADLTYFGVNIPTPLRGLFGQAIAPFQQVLGGSKSNPIPTAPSGTILGVSYLTAGVVMLAGLMIAFLWRRR